MELLLVYTTDNHHSFASRDLIGVVDSDGSFIDLVKSHARDVKGLELTDADVFNLQSYGQTQNLDSDFEYASEWVKTNTVF